jgi:hypothetical protein
VNRERLDLIPDDLLRPGKHACQRLEAWLWERGWSLSLYDLDTERRRRGLIRGGHQTRPRTDRVPAGHREDTP